MSRLPCFKSYDVRGQIGSEIDRDLCVRIGRAFVTAMETDHVVVGHDARETSPEFAAAIAEGATSAGAKVSHIGLCGTEEVYFATDHLGAGGGLMVTASHNPIDYNGIKMVGPKSTPIPWEGGLSKINDLTVADEGKRDGAGVVEHVDTRAAYVEKVLSFIDVAALKPMKIVMNAGNGAAGPTFDAIAAELKRRGAPLTFVRQYFEPDATFPNGIPNPLLEQNRAATADLVTAEGADLGVAWDGDFDRCFFFDQEGGFIDGEYVVSLLAAAFLDDHAGAKIVHDPRVIWNTQAIVAEKGGEAVMSKTGHALIKAKMREVDAIYGGEMSAHHYFRDFVFCDSGMIPWLLVVQHIARSGETLKDLVKDMQEAYPSSGEINFTVEDADATLARVEAALAGDAAEVAKLDGLSMAFDGWRVNLRKSNTEPLVRLNLEAQGNRALLQEKVALLTDLVTQGA